MMWCKIEDSEVQTRGIIQAVSSAMSCVFMPSSTFLDISNNLLPATSQIKVKPTQVPEYMIHSV